MALDPEWQDFFEDIIETTSFERETVKLNLEQKDIIAQIKSHHIKMGIEINDIDYSNNFEKAICKNTFSIVGDNKDILLENMVFKEAIFDKELDTGIGKVNLDFCLSNDEVILGIVSKFTGMLKNKPPNHENNLQKYINQKQLEFLPNGLIKLIKHYVDLNEDLFLDIAHLINLSIGLLNNANNRKAGLVYVYWTPSNYHKIPIYEKHFSEIEFFKYKIRDFLSFKAVTYDKFWSFYQDYEKFRVQFLELKNLYSFEIQDV